MIEGWSFNPPPYWPRPPAGWDPSPAWRPDPRWGPLPPGWQLWVKDRPGQLRPVIGMVSGAVAVLGIGVAAALTPPAPVTPPASARTPPSAGVAPAPGSAASGSAASGPVGRSQPAVPTTQRPAPSPSLSPPAQARTSPAASATTATPASPSAPTVTAVRVFASCSALNVNYPHGVGRPTAIDRTTGPRVANFGRSAALYLANGRLDADRDGIACERL